MKKLPLRLKVYILLIYFITIIAFGYLYIQGSLNLERIPSFNVLLFFGAISILTENVSVNYKRMSFSSTFAITTAVFLLYGPMAAIIVRIVGQTFKVVKLNNKYKHLFNTPFYGTLFNYCTLALSVLVSSFFYIELGGSYKVDQLLDHKLAVFIFFFTMFFINNLIIAILNSIMTNKSLFYSFINGMRLVSLNILAMAPFGVILAFVFDKYDYLGIAVVLMPIVLARYTFYLYIEAKGQYIETVDALMKAIEERDPYTEGHSQRVSELAVKIAKALKYSEWKIEDLKIASMLHDVGKIGIRDQILDKPSKLTQEEFEIIKGHPQKGYNILCNIKNLEHIVPIVRHHHERYDGKGYPNGMSADELNLDVFIVQLADSVDAMATDRPYRKAMNTEEIINEVKRCSGTQFHPDVVKAYLSVLQKEGKLVE
jgi:HD-GYP domain-containing protein (c-di-GMP phosphodiesterase class II)